MTQKRYRATWFISRLTSAAAARVALYSVVPVGEKGFYITHAMVGHSVYGPSR
jgi:hypothetical protein